MVIHHNDWHNISYCFHCDFDMDLRSKHHDAYFNEICFDCDFELIMADFVLGCHSIFPFDYYYNLIFA